MNKILALLLFAQFISFTQTAQVKQAADACPGANKNNRTSNDYAYLSKRSAANSTSDFSKPKYQSIYAKNTNSSTSAKRGKTSSFLRAAAPETKTVKNTEQKQPTVVPEKKNKSSKSIREPETIVKSEPEEVKEIAKPIEVEKAKVESTPVSEPAKKEKGKSVSSKKVKKPLETTTDTNTKKKQKQKYRAKKIKCGKGSATDCPQF